MIARIAMVGVLAMAGMTLGADKKSSLDSKDTKFLKEAAMGGMAEVEMGQTAERQGSSDAVKEFGRRMVTDHGKEMEELKTLAHSKGVELETKLDKDHQKMADKLSKLNGADFDKAYAKYELEDHKEDVKKFKKEADKAEDADVKAFAAKQVPVLEEHLSMAEKLPGNSSGGHDSARTTRGGEHESKAKQSQ